MGLLNKFNIDWFRDKEENTKEFISVYKDQVYISSGLVDKLDIGDCDYVKLGVDKKRGVVVAKPTYLPQNAYKITTNNTVGTTKLNNLASKNGRYPAYTTDDGSILVELS